MRYLEIKIPILDSIDEDITSDHDAITGLENLFKADLTINIDKHQTNETEDIRIFDTANISVKYRDERSEVK